MLPRMKLLVALLVTSFAAVVVAQPIPPASIRDKEIGWIQVFGPGNPRAAVTVDHRTYSPAQLAFTDLFRTWIQATYIPKGGLGDGVLQLSEKLTPYNQNTAALPQSYGAYARIYTDLKYGPNQKIERASNSHIVWSLLANGFMGEAADNISTPQRYYFTLPLLVQQSNGSPELEKALDLSRHPVLGRFPSYLQRNTVNGNRKWILMAKDHQLPYRQLTKGEYLAAIEAAVIRLNESEMTKLLGDANKRFIELQMPDTKAKHAKRLAVLEANKARYQNRFSEPAEISTTAPDGMLENSSSADVFEGNGSAGPRFKVYTIDPEVVARAAKSDQPLWILIGWTAEILTDPVSKHLHEAVIKRFNFEYVYNYLFEPEKVKGIAYTPLS